MVPDPALAEGAQEEVQDARAVRPYTLTGGRTRSRSAVPVALEALVRAQPGAPAPRSPEGRAILRLTADAYLSVAELSAHLALPLGVVRVLVGDLADDGLATVQGTPSAAAPGSGPATDPSFLRSVLDGIATL